MEILFSLQTNFLKSTWDQEKKPNSSSNLGIINRCHNNQIIILVLFKRKKTYMVKKNNNGNTRANQQKEVYSSSNKLKSHSN